MGEGPSKGKHSQRLVFSRVAEIPGLDNPALGSIDIFLVLDLLDANANAILGEDDILLAHALLGRLADLADAEVDLVADPSGAGEDEKEDDEREDLPGKRGRVLTRAEAGSWV